jgi:hypothetical protein
MVWYLHSPHRSSLQGFVQLREIILDNNRLREDMYVFDTVDGAATMR